MNALETMALGNWHRETGTEKLAQRNNRRRSRFAKNNLVRIIVRVKSADKRKLKKYEWRLE